MIIILLIFIMINMLAIKNNSNTMEHDNTVTLTSIEHDNLENDNHITLTSIEHDNHITLTSIEKAEIPPHVLSGNAYESIKEHLIRLSPSIHKCSFIGWHLVKVVSVYDGDTVNVLLVLGITGFKFGLRIYGIDTAEIKSRNPILKNYAIKSRNFLQTLLKPEHIYIARIIDNDKYGGRLIADIFYKNDKGEYCSVSDVMLTNNFALPYNGKTKENEQNWLTFIADKVTQS